MNKLIADEFFNRFNNIKTHTSGFTRNDVEKAKIAKQIE